MNIRRISIVIFLMAGWSLAGCAMGPYAPLEKSPSTPTIQHSQRIVILDRNVRGALILINSVQKRLPGGQILVQANFQNRYANDDVWAEIKFEFQDENHMTVDETEWVNTHFPRWEVTTVQGNSISGKAIKHVMLLRNLSTRTGRLPETLGNIFELPAFPVPVPN